MINLIFVCKSELTFDKVELEPSMDVSDDGTPLRSPLNMVQRGEHNIDDELVFSNHPGYIFHDSRGIESGSIEELGILQEFIRRKCGETRLRDRLHTIWLDSRVFKITTADNHVLRYCVPMDNQRPQLDLKFYQDICPDQNGPSFRNLSRLYLTHHS